MERGKSSKDPPLQKTSANGECGIDVGITGHPDPLKLNLSLFPLGPWNQIYWILRR
jgi:hypothetical protein